MIITYIVLYMYVNVIIIIIYYIFMSISILYTLIRALLPINKC